MVHILVVHNLNFIYLVTRLHLYNVGNERVSAEVVRYFFRITTNREGEKMEIDSKMLMELAEQLGMDSGEKRKGRKTTELADQIKGKSDQELINEILNLKKMMKNDKAQFDKQMKAIKAIRVMMNDEQKARLETIIRLLESDD